MVIAEFDTVISSEMKIYYVYTIQYSEILNAGNVI